MIRKKDYNKGIEYFTEKNGEGCYFIDVCPLYTGKELCLVLGYKSDFEKGEKYQVEKDGILYTLCAKLAININDLQESYDTDWYMPFDVENWQVWDTEIAVTGDKDIKWFNHQAKLIKKGFDDLELTI